MIKREDLDKIFTSRVFNLGEIVFIVTDNFQEFRMVTGIKMNMNGAVVYELSVGSHTSWHYTGELSRNRFELISKEEGRGTDNL